MAAAAVAVDTLEQAEIPGPNRFDFAIASINRASSVWRFKSAER